MPGAALFFSVRQDASYESSSEVLLSRQNLGAMLTNTTDPSFLGNDEERSTATQAALAHGPAVAARHCAEPA